MSIMIIDYGMGNLGSVQRALEEVGASVFISDNPADIKESSALVLPGVGSFSEGMANLNASGMVDPIRQAISDDQIPLLGICLGMQLLAEKGEEGGIHDGLGLIPGTVKIMTPVGDERLPHIGWNEVTPVTEHPMFQGIEDRTDFYFVHSYHFQTTEEHRIATAPYAGTISAAVARDNIWGVQYHPEKSSKPGLKLLENFVHGPPVV